MGDTFKFSFSGRGLPPDTNYTLIYYPDDWPGDGLICLGSGKPLPLGAKGKVSENRDMTDTALEIQGGNLNIHGDVELNTGLPAPL